MAKTLMEVRQQIEGLKAIEEKLRREEAQGVIARIREAISVYGLTPADLFDTQTRTSPPKTSKSKAMNATIKYADGQGNTWSGRGRRPLWISAALELGRSIEEFATAASPAAASPRKPGKTRRSPKGAASRKDVPVKYRDGENTWSGRGSQPRWITAALADGKRLEDFAI